MRGMKLQLGQSLEEELSKCKTCLLGKQARLPFKGGGWKACEKLQLGHTDLCGARWSILFKTFFNYSLQILREKDGLRLGALIIVMLFIKDGDLAGQ